MNIQHKPDAADKAVALFSSLAGGYGKSSIVKDSESTLSAVSNSIDSYESVSSMVDSMKSQLNTDAAILNRTSSAFTTFDKRTASKMKLKRGTK